MTAYQEALQVTLGNEGGWYAGDEARDPNPTMYGVTQNTYNRYRTGLGLPVQTVRNISQVEVEDIYWWYWMGAGCPRLGRLSALMLFDHSINAGPNSAIKILQRACGTEPDGAFGPKTEAAAKSMDDAVLAERIGWERLRFYCDLAKSPRMAPNLLSWTLRVVKIRERFLR